MAKVSPGAPAVLYGDEAGVTGGDDPYNRVTYPWADLGGKPDELPVARLAVPALVRIDPRGSRPDLFVLLWLGLPLLFFSLAGSKLPGYILPCVPPLAILMGRTADRMVTEGPTPERQLSGRVADAFNAMVLEDKELASERRHDDELGIVGGQL